MKSDRENPVVGDVRVVRVETSYGLLGAAPHNPQWRKKMKKIGISAFAILALCCVTVTAQTWSQTPTASDPPVRRENPGTSNGTHMYVFGGQTGNSGGVPLNDLWQFDGTTWTQMTADGAAGSPPARDRAGVTWDWTNNKLIVFGGEDLAGAALGDTWEWDPATNAWTDVTPVGLSPSARKFTALAYDWANFTVMMFGGLDGAGAHKNDTWHFNGTTWTELTPVGPLPNIRRQHVLVGRSDFFDVILAGGQDAGGAGFLGDTWKWDGVNWTEIVTVNQPAGVVAIDAAYDLQRQRIVIASGNPGPTALNSEFDSLTNDWVVLPLDPGIFKCTRYFMAYIAATGKTYKVSGQALNSAAPADKTYENGLGLPAPYPGSGEDLVLGTGVNAAAETLPDVKTATRRRPDQRQRRFTGSVTLIPAARDHRAALHDRRAAVEPGRFPRAPHRSLRRSGSGPPLRRPDGRSLRTADDSDRRPEPRLCRASRFRRHLRHHAGPGFHGRRRERFLLGHRRSRDPVLLKTDSGAAVARAR